MRQIENRAFERILVNTIYRSRFTGLVIGCRYPAITPLISLDIHLILSIEYDLLDTIHLILSLSLSLD